MQCSGCGVALSPDEYGGKCHLCAILKPDKDTSKPRITQKKRKSNGRLHKA